MGFSDDGRWWWDGSNWLASAQVVIPDLPVTDFERSGKLEVARGRRKDAERLTLASGFPALTLLAGAASIGPFNEASGDYRTWTLEQLALATAYLLGPDEPMTAGDGGTLVTGELDLPPFRRDLAVAVTRDHVLVFRIDSVDGQPRWIALAGRSKDVTIELQTGLHRGTKGLTFGSDLRVSGWSGQWTIHSSNPDPVVEAWRAAARTGPS